ncbi:MAG: cupin domain-containing protein, partial [Actinomycetota bacterium]
MSKGDGGEGVVDVESAPESESESEPERAVERIIGRLGLRPHPEGGWYAETWRESGQVRGARAAGTAIYFLLRAGERSHWHRIDSAEIWHHYAGAPLELRTWTDAGGEVHRRLGTDLAGGERPQ